MSPAPQKRERRGTRPTKIREEGTSRRGLSTVIDDPRKVEGETSHREPPEMERGAGGQKKWSPGRDKRL